LRAPYAGWRGIGARLGVDAPAHTAAAAQPADRTGLVADYFAADVLERAFKAYELILADERHGRRRRIGGRGGDAKQVVVDGAVQQHAIAPRAEFDVGAYRRVAGDQLVASRPRHPDMLRCRVVHPDDGLKGPFGDRLMQ